MKISDLHNDDKPREKALASGVERLTDAELLAILMATGTRDRNVIELANEMLAHCERKLPRLARMSVGEMVRTFAGVGPAKAITIKAALAFGSRAKVAELADDASTVFNSPGVVYDFLWPKMACLEHEEFVVLLLSRSAKLKGQVLISQGGTGATVVDVKMVVRAALDRMADRIILVHNHPSGTLVPSQQDDNLTHRIAEASKLFDITVLDHVIVTSKGYYSYRDSGRL